VNPQWHDEFVTLCALFPSGELTEEEWALLQVHLAYCDSCRVAFEEYQQLVNDVMPAMAASAYAESDNKPESSSFSLEAAEQRLMNQVTSAPSHPNVFSSRKTTWRVAGGIAASAVGVACLIGLHFLRLKPQRTTQAVVVAHVEGASKSSVPAKPETDLRPALELAERQVARLQQQLSTEVGQYRQSSSTAANIKQQLEEEQAGRQKISEERDSLTRQLAAAQIEAQSLRDKSAEAGATTAQQIARTGALEARVHELNATLDEKDRMLALDKEFLAHDREIRDLIAARNLYIADIYDVAQTGQTAKPFGRIFYTKDKSLVFYGYDLDKQTGLKQSVAFQAWGSGDDKQNVSLGLFYQDDTHKRWVLRFSDTKTLARLNMVFVTAEPQGGSTKPTGKPLLLAYLQMQPNHP
jgi:hypothetical protein